MKKLFAVLLCFCLLTGCGVQEKNPHIQNVQTQIEMAQSLLGVAYLDCVEGSFSAVQDHIKDQPYVRTYSFISEVEDTHFAQNEGDELYCVVPLDDSVTISVFKAELDTQTSQLKRGEELLSHNDGMPVLIRGNLSETVPNLMIVATKGDLAMEYTPCISLKNGLLENSERLIYDFTPYELIPHFNGLNEEVSWNFFGDWVCTVSEPMLGDIDMQLSISAEGIEYSFQSETMTGSYTGNWLILSDQRLRMELGGEARDSSIPDVSGLHTDVDGIYFWDVRDGNLFLTYINGTPWYPSAVVTEYRFVPAN